MGAPLQDVCAPWCTVDDAGSPCSDYGADLAAFNRFALVASNLLYKLTFRRYPGICRETIRPCPHETLSCGCGGVSSIEMPSGPLVDIVSMTLDGETLDPSYYRIDNYRELVRLESPDGVRSWPCWQDHRVPATEADTWSVTYDYGLEPPEDGVMAAAALACQLTLAWNPRTLGECRLPKRVTSMVRQGVAISVLDPMDLFDKGRTGLADVDLFVAAERFGRAQRPATVRRLGTGRRARRCTNC